MEIEITFNNEILLKILWYCKAWLNSSYSISQLKQNLQCCQKRRGDVCAALKLHISPWAVKWIFSGDNRIYFLFKKNPYLFFRRLRLQIAAWFSHGTILHLLSYSAVCQGGSASWSQSVLGGAFTERFHNSCTGACSKYIQRAQKVKGTYKVRDTPGIWDIPSGEHHCFLFQIIDINPSPVFPQVSALLRHWAHLRTVMQYFVLSLSLLAWPSKFTAQGLIITKRWLSLAKGLISALAMCFRHLSYFIFSAWNDPILLTERFILRLKWGAVIFLGIFNLKLVCWTVGFFGSSRSDFNSLYLQQWVLSNFVLCFGHPWGDSQAKEHVRKGCLKWFMDIASHGNFMAGTWKGPNSPEQGSVVCTTAHPPSFFLILLSLQEPQRRQGILQTAASCVCSAQFISLGTANTHGNEDCALDLPREGQIEVTHPDSKWGYCQIWELGFAEQHFPFLVENTHVYCFVRFCPLNSNIFQILGLLIKVLVL